MQNLKYYVLWTKNSPLIQEYKHKFYNKLLWLLDSYFHTWLLNSQYEILLKTDDLKMFLSNTDISSLICFIDYQKENWNHDLVKSTISDLEKEIQCFLSEGIDSDNLAMNSGKIINNTKIRLSVTDNNPYAEFNLHPDHKTDWVWVGWWDLSENNWIDNYSKTFELLKSLDEWIYDELNQIISKIIPFWTSKSVHNSWSYKDAIGHLYLWYTLDSDAPEINNLEAIIHESSHNKLNLIMHFDPIVLNNRDEIYYSAIRPDARPIIGVFLGYHAFAPTMYILMKAYVNWALDDKEYWLWKIVLYHIKTKFLQRVIKKHAQLTPIGKEVSGEIDFVISKMDALYKEINPPKSVISDAKKLQIEHFKNVNRQFSYLMY